MGSGSGPTARFEVTSVQAHCPVLPITYRTPIYSHTSDMRTPPKFQYGFCGVAPFVQGNDTGKAKFHLGWDRELILGQRERFVGCLRDRRVLGVEEHGEVMKPGAAHDEAVPHRVVIWHTV